MPDFQMTSLEDKPKSDHGGDEFITINVFNMFNKQIEETHKMSKSGNGGLIQEICSQMLTN